MHQYFYEYDFDELRIRPRHVCPYAVVSFQFKGKDAPLKVTPLAPLRSVSQTSDGIKGRTKYTVWSGELVNEGKTVSRISFCSYSPPFMPFRLPEKLELGLVMRMDQVTEMIPSALFSWNLYAGSHEVLKNGMYCNLLEVVDNSKSGDSLTALLQNLETQRLVLVHMLTDKGFLFLLSSGQMVTLTERRDGWKNCLQALFVFQESRDVAKYSTRCPASQDPLQSLSSQDGIMPQLNRFVPALHYALVKVRCNPPTDLSAGVEHQAKDYLSGLHDGKIRHIPMTEYDAKLDDRGKLFPAPKHHKLNIEGYLRSYVYSPNLYTMPVARAHEMVETYCVIPEEDSPAASWESVEVVLDKPVVASQVKPVGTTTTAHPLTVHVNLPPSQSPADTKQQKVKKLINIILKCHRNAEADVQKTGEAQGLGGLDPRGLKRKLEREVTTRTLKYLKKASWERGGWDSTAVGEGGLSPVPSLSSVMLQSVGLRDVDLRIDRSEAAIKLDKMLTSLKNAEAKQGRGSGEGVDLTEAPLVDRMIKLGLPPNQDVDLRKRVAVGLQDKADYLEEQTAGSISSLEGFSPSSNGEMPRRSQSQPHGVEQIPWVLIPITGLKSKKYCQREKDNPQDPRFIPQIPLAISSYSPCTLQRRERSITPTLEEPLESSPPSPSLEEPPEPSPTPSPYPSPYPSPCPSPSSSPMEQEEQLAESPCDATELSSNDKMRTNHSWFETGVAPENKSLLEKRSSHSPEPAEKPSPIISVEAAQEEAEGSMLTKDPSTIDVEPGMGEEKEETVGEEAKALQMKEEEDVQGEFEEVGHEALNVEEVGYPEEEANNVKDGMEMVAEAEEVAGVDMIEDEKQEEQLEEGELEEEEEKEQVEKEVEDVEQRMKATETVSPFSLDPIPPEQTQVRNPLFHTVPLIQNVPPKQNIPPIHCPTASRMDCILDQQFSNFSTELQILLLRESVHYSSPHPPFQNPPRQSPLQPFSEYVSFYNSSPPMHAYVSSLRDRMGTVIDTQEQWIPSMVAHNPPPGSAETRHHHDPTTQYNWNRPLGSEFQSYPNCHSPNPFGPGPDGSNSYGSHAASQFPSTVSQFHSSSGSNSGVMPSSSDPGTAYPQASPFYDNPPQAGVSCQMSSSLAPLPVQSWMTETNTESAGTGESERCKPSAESNMDEWAVSMKNADVAGHVSRGKYPPHMGTVFESGAIAEALPPFTPIIDRLSGPMVESVPGSGQTPPEDISSLISQLKPELFTNLVEIIKDVRKNAVQFYIHTQDSDREFSHYIKEYLQRMGNMECSPLSFLEKDNRNDKLMVLIQNKDIAAHVHKVPALVQLKRQPTVVFAGVDSLDDVKNHTYNELFVSGGFVVSDEFVLNPDYITHERLRVILTFLDQQNSAESLWRWRVHCKTQKKLKEQSRFKSEAMKILNLLTTYQKKNVVEFLPYHECDAPSRTAPDLDCLIKLQAQHIQQRHIIFLTEHHHETFHHYSSSGIVIANIKDIMHNFGSLVGFHDIRDKLSTSEDLIAAATTGREDKRVLKEPILLASPSSPDCLVDRLSTPLNEDDFRVPVPDQMDTPEAPSPTALNFQALSEAISQFKANKAARSQMEAPEGETRPDSPPGPRIPGLGTDSPVRPVTTMGTINSEIGYLAPVSLLGPLHPDQSTAGIQDGELRHTIAATLTPVHSELGLGMSSANEVTSSCEDPNTFGSPLCPAAVTGENRELRAIPGNTNESLGPEPLRTQGGENTKPAPVADSCQGVGGKTSSLLPCPNPVSAGPRVGAPRPSGGDNTAAERLAQVVRLQQGNGLLPRPNLNLGNHNMGVFQRSMMNGLGGPGGIRPLMPNPMPPGAAMGLGQAAGPGSCLWVLQQQNLWLGGNSFSPRLMGNPHHPWGANQTANQGRGNRPWKR
ncbi:uncharacterized protein tasora isoform X2 [Esox lucius]|uniref:uncharacterized protein tasora isoform X2 n=1 Tax=Esox lucius TaxID=8010 RepID=UPI0014768409|nr:uncharacterized protein tasora isoform X2 [Esox lucius]